MLARHIQGTYYTSRYAIPLTRQIYAWPIHFTVRLKDIFRMEYSAKQAALNGSLFLLIPIIACFFATVYLPITQKATVCWPPARFPRQAPRLDKA